MPPSDVDFHDLKMALKRHGAECESTRHGHWKVRRGDLVYTFPTVSGRKVKAIYIPKIRRKLRLDEESGVTDKDFWGK